MLALLLDKFVGQLALCAAYLPLMAIIHIISTRQSCAYSSPAAPIKQFIYMVTLDTSTTSHPRHCFRPELIVITAKTRLPPAESLSMNAKRQYRAKSDEGGQLTQSLSQNSCCRLISVARMRDCICSITLFLQVPSNQCFAHIIFPS